MNRFLGILFLVFCIGFVNPFDGFGAINNQPTAPDYCGYETKAKRLYSGKSIIIENIFYDLGKWTLRPESKQALDSLVCFLKANPSLVIEVGTHTDSRASESFGLNLSQKRAQSVVDYLIENGIDAERLVAKGYSESKPRVIDHDFSYFKKGDVLDERFISKLDPKSPEFEEAHQQNRRTEIGLLRDDYVPRFEKKVEQPAPKAESKCDGYFEYDDADFCVGEIHRTSNIYFDLSRGWDLVSEVNTSAFDSIYEFLLKHPNVKIEVGSHTDSRASETYNLVLSEKRARSIVDYLIEKGIDTDRMTYKGYGESTPYLVREDFSFFKKGDVLNEDSIMQFPQNDLRYEEARQMNRRTEIKIIEIGIKLPEQKKYRATITPSF